MGTAHEQTRTLLNVIRTLKYKQFQYISIYTLWYESTVAGYLSFIAKRFVTLRASLKFVFFLVTAGPTRHKIFEIFAWPSNTKILKIYHSFPLNSTSSFRESTSNPQPSHIFRWLSVGLAQRCLLFLFWYMWCEEYKAGSSHVYVIIIIIIIIIIITFFFNSFQASHDLFTQLHLSTECGQNKTKPKHYRKYLRFVSALFLFCFCRLNVEPHPHPGCWPTKTRSAYTNVNEVQTKRSRMTESGASLLVFKVYLLSPHTSLGYYA